jgi:hypothetical protein
MKIQWSAILIAYALSHAAAAMPATLCAQQLPALPSDSIVTLAIDPARHGGVPWVTLLDEEVMRLEPDGKSSTRHRQVLQLLTDAGARAKAEQSFGYSPGHQSFALNWVRVLKPNGTVVSDKAAQEQDADIPVAMQNPVYADQKLRRLTLAGVAAGTILDLSWTTDEKSPYRSGDFYERWYVNAVSDVVRSRFVLNTPESFKPRIVERNLNFHPREEVVGGRRETVWAAGPLNRIRNEAFAADSNDVIMSVSVAPQATWNDIAGWYHGLAKDRYALTPMIAKRVDSVVAAARPKTRLDTIRALHRWVAQDVRYVSVSLGIGGFQPRTPERVLSTGFGDCKDKATLFVAAARKYGMDVNPVLLSSAAPPDRSTPSIYQFNHAIAAVRNGKTWTFTDLTAETVPYGMLPPSYQGYFGIVVLPSGLAEEVKFPESPPDSNTNVVRFTGELKADGSLVARVDDYSTGLLSLQNRASFYVPMDSSRQLGALRAIGSAYYRDGVADSLTTFNGRDLQSPARVSFRISTREALKSAGSLKLLTIPTAFRGPAPTYTSLARNLAAAPPRLFNIDAARVLGPVSITTEFVLTLPVGWSVDLPPNVTATSFVGRYSVVYVQEGRVLRITRSVVGARGVYAPQRVVEIVEWLKAASADDNEFIQLKPGP